MFNLACTLKDDASSTLDHIFPTYVETVVPCKKSEWVLSWVIIRFIYLLLVNVVPVDSFLGFELVKLSQRHHFNWLKEVLLSAILWLGLLQVASSEDWPIISDSIFVYEAKAEENEQVISVDERHAVLPHLVKIWKLVVDHFEVLSVLVLVFGIHHKVEVIVTWVETSFNSTNHVQLTVVLSLADREVLFVVFGLEVQ